MRSKLVAAAAVVASVVLAARPPMPELVLGNSGAAGEWRLCAEGQCHTLSEILGHPVGANTITMSVRSP
jgi:hypothetical protein